MKQSYFFTLVSLLNDAGWYYLYMVGNGKGKNSTTTYYLVPYYEQAASIDAMIEALVSTFGADTTYIYAINDVNNIWRLDGRPMLEITLPNK